MARWYHSECYFGKNIDASWYRNDLRVDDKKVTTGNMSDIPGFHGLAREQEATLKKYINKHKHQSASSIKPSGTAQS